jgi:hypothetical protein
MANKEAEKVPYWKTRGIKPKKQVEKKEPKKQVEKKEV